MCIYIIHVQCTHLPIPRHDHLERINTFFLWSADSVLPEAMAEVDITIKVPWHVQIRGSWGHELITCTFNEDGSMLADLPNLHPGVYHYHFLVNGHQVFLFSIACLICFVSVL